MPQVCEIQVKFRWQAVEFSGRFAKFQQNLTAYQPNIKKSGQIFFAPICIFTYLFLLC
ncbi:hypothetical protein MHA_0292 [Mannheimia haemolytica PHL213]|nr:hypothetical protein MHA_0292 [Mannheimia haemolytica PHL213]